MTEPDFSGWATKHNTPCTDGRTILNDAFKEDDGAVVPLVYQHGHTDIDDVLGHVKLENRPEGVRAHAFFNQTTKGQNAKELVRHGDIKWLSVYANNLIEKAQNGLKAVVHGKIREVSLVLAGANPGALIDNVSVVHGDGSFEVILEEGHITTGEVIEPNLAHAEAAVTEPEAPAGETNDLRRIIDTMNEEQQTALNYLLAQALVVGGEEGESAAHSGLEGEGAEGESSEGTESTEGEGSEDAESTEGEGSEGSEAAEGEGSEGSEGVEGAEGAESESSEGVEGESSEGSEGGESAEGESSEGAEDESSASESSEGEGNNDNGTSEAGDAVQHNTNQEDNSMTHNAFDQFSRGGASNSMAHQQTKLSRDEVKDLMRQVVDGNTTLSSVLKHYAQDKGVTIGGELKHGIENIDYLFPDFKTLESSPAFISRRMEWVDKVLGAVRKAPFARIKTVTADITPDEARARGYITGNMKNEEFFELSKRETSPQTIYKKQKLDRDDVIDIADLDVIAWLKAEMKVMLDEEIASAILFGDGRSSGDEDKIKEANIRPIATDAELYVTKVNVNLGTDGKDTEALVDAALENREFYKGTGQPTFYTTQAVLAKFKMAKDDNGQRYYKTNADIAASLDVADVVPVETMGRLPNLIGIMVNLADYTIGTDRGGQATMFDDFDLDYNKLRYLLETRLSGALTQPKSAVVFNKVVSTDTLVAPDVPAFNTTTGVLTVPSKTGVVYKNADTDATLTAGAQTAIAAGATVNVKAVAASGYYFTNDQSDEWSFTRDAA